MNKPNSTSTDSHILAELITSDLFSDIGKLYVEVKEAVLDDLTKLSPQEIQEIVGYFNSKVYQEYLDLTGQNLEEIQTSDLQ